MDCGNIDTVFGSEKKGDFVDTGFKEIENMEWYLIGITAALLTTFGFVPQILKMLRTRSSKDVSLATLFQFSAGVILWALYGLYIRDSIIIVANVITFITLVIAIVLYYHNQK